MDNKKCPQCEEEKKVCEFHLKKTESRYSSWCKKCLYKYQKKRWIDRKKKAVHLMGSECSICGYDKNYAALDFHHVDPSEKEADWKSLRLKKWDSVIKELQKCVLLCKNCHAEVHNPDLTTGDSSCLKDNVLLNRGLKPTGSCPVCDSPVYGTLCCSVSCSSVSRRKVIRPSADELKDLIKDNSYVQLGKMFSVSDVTIKKWAKQYELVI